METKRPEKMAALLVAVCFSAVLVGTAAAEVPPGSLAPGRAGDSAIGASVAHPAGWRMEREQVTYDDTYGYTLWRPDASADHGGTPAVRVAFAYDLRPGQIETRVRERLAEFEDIPAKRQAVTVGEKGYRGVAVGPIPGSTPSVEVYVPVQGRVYRVNVYREVLDAQARELLASLRFAPPSRSAASLDRIPDANAPETLYRGDEELRKREEAARRETTAEAPSSGETSRTASLTASEVPVYGERQIAEGCWLADSRHYVQTPHGMYANSYANDPGPDIPTGYTVLGRPNFWGDYTHGSLGYGRCNSPIYTNDKFAVDLPLNRGNVIFSPFRRGTVVFAGRAETHKGYGIFVVIQDANGKYVSLNAHLNGLARDIYRGKTVSNTTVIGFAGETGDGVNSVGPVHLHQAFYRYPRFNPDGSPYGGQGLQTIYHHYAGNGGGIYKYGVTADSTTKGKGSLVSY